MGRVILTRDRARTGVALDFANSQPHLRGYYVVGGRLLIKRYQDSKARPGLTCKTLSAMVADNPAQVAMLDSAPPPPCSIAAEWKEFATGS